MTLVAHGFVVLFQIFAGIWPPPPPPPPLPPVPVPTMGGARGGACGHEAGQGNIFGESAAIRGEAPGISIPEPLARAIAAARMSLNRAQAMQFLSPDLGNGQDATSRYARIQLAYALLRLTPLEPGAEDEVIRTLLSPEVAFAGSSDAQYISAVLLRAQGRQAEALAAVERAVAINPQFYNAVMLQALLLLADADRTFRDSGSCAPLFDVLKRSVVPVAELGACPLQLAHFRLALHRELPPVKTPRRDELLRIVDIALAYAARKDVIHAQLLQSQTEADPAAAQCTKELQRHDFGNPVE